MSSARVVTNLIELIGQTPLVQLQKTARVLPSGTHRFEINLPVGTPLKSKLFAKVEFFNPGGSVKDRIAKRIIEGAERQGLLKPGGTVVEATSGNTGAGLAVVAAIKGYRAVLVMPDKMSSEKINALRAFGAKVVIVPSANIHPEHPDYYCNVAKRLSQSIPGAFLANQYFNPDNPLAHYETTGPEIWQQMNGKVDLFFAGVGTGGTMSGTAKYLKEKNSALKAIAVDPDGSIYAGLIQNKKPSQVKPYLVEGIGEDMMPGTMDLNFVDDVIVAGDKESFAATQLLAQQEGLLVGGSCGSAFYGAIQYLAQHESRGGKPLNAVVLLPDSGSRYLSKVFNDQWLSSKDVKVNWENVGLRIGEVEYLPSANKVDGV